MTITTETNRIAYAGNGSSTSFATGWPFYGPDELRVYATSALGVQSTLVRGSDYSVLGGNGGDGTVVAAVAPASGVTWTIVRATTPTQQVGIASSDPLPGPMLERALDRLTALAQEALGGLLRTLRVPEGEATSPAALPSATSRAGKVLAFDSAGTPVASTLTTGTVAISTPMADVVGAASLAAARTAMGARRHVDVVKDHAADNTGTTDAAAAIQAAIDSLTSGVVYLPPGTYKLASDVTLKPNVILLGEDPLLTTIVAGANSLKLLKYTAAALTNMFVVKGIGLSGGGYTGVYGIHLDGTDSAKRISLVNIEDVYVASCARGINAIFLANSRLENVRANACAIGIYVDQCADTLIEGGWAQNGTAEGIYVNGGGGAFDEGIRIVGYSTNGQVKGISVNGQDWGQITGCSLTTCSGGVLNFINSSNWQIAGGQFAVGGGSPANPGISADVNCAGLQITGNLIALNTFGVNLLGTGHIVEGNRFTGNGSVDINLQATRSVVSGNICHSTGSATSILEQAGSDFNNINGNATNGTVTIVGAGSVSNGNNSVY